jgi:outer membrane lipoprotein-sorting protein
MQAMLQNPRARILLFLGIVLLMVGAALLLRGREQAGEDSTPLRSFYFQARVEVEHDVRPGEEDEVLDTIRGWYEAPERWRWEVSHSDPARVEEGSIQVSDGDGVWFYERPTNTYYRLGIDEYFSALPPDMRGKPPILVASFLVGPLPYADAERFFASWAGVTLQQRDGGVVLGRPTLAVVLTRGSNTTTFWLDRQHPFVLKYESATPGSPVSLVRAEVTELKLGSGVNDRQFRFEPPAGSRQVDPPAQPAGGSATGGSMGVGEVQVPPGFLKPAYLPEGYGSTKATNTSGLGGVTQFSVRLERSGEGAAPAYLIIEEQMRAGGLPQSLKTGDAVRVGGQEAFRQTQAGELRLVWAEGDVVVTLRTDKLPFQELLKVAESME